MESTRRPLAVVAAGVTLTVVSGMATLSAGLEASSRAGSGQFAVADHDGMAPGGGPALVLLLGLLLIGVGAAMHDGRRLRATVPRPAARPTSRTADAAARATAPGAGQGTAGSLRAQGASRPVYVITTLPQAPARPAAAPTRQQSPPRRRRTSSGARIELVGASRRS